MADVSPGQLSPLLRGYRTTAGGVSGAGTSRIRPVSFAHTTAGGVVGIPGNRLYNGSLLNCTQGTKIISGYTYQNSLPVSRRVALFRQGPPHFFVAEMVTPASTGVYSFTGLAAGTYFVVDFNYPALIYDTVVSGP